MRDLLKRLWARIKKKDVYIGSDGHTKAARDINAGETITFTLDEMGRMKK